MIYRTPSGQVIGSTKPKSQVVDPTCWPSVQKSGQTVQQTAGQPLGTSQPGQYKLEPLPSFPKTLFQFEKYDGARALTAILLLLATIYFLSGFLGFLFDHTPWLRELFHKTPLPDAYPKRHGGSSGKRSAKLSPILPPTSISPFDYLYFCVPIA